MSIRHSSFGTRHSVLTGAEQLRAEGFARLRGRRVGLLTNPAGVTSDLTSLVEADRLGQRLAREQRMFETAHAAMGNSKSADNLADIADMTKYDPGVMSAILRGSPKEAVMAALTRAIAETQGKSRPVVERLTKTLLERNPEEARRMLSAVAEKKAYSDGVRNVARSILTTMGASTTARLAAP